jgi:hypothetical protein
MTNEFYVYCYLDPSKKQNFETSLISVIYKPLYIGKGKKDRYKHGINAINELNAALTNKRLFCKLRNLQNNNFPPLVIKIFENLTNEEALNIEEKLIFELGRKTFDNNGILLNIALGGQIPDTTGVPPINKGKKIDDIYSSEKCIEIRELLKKPKTKEQNDKMVKTRKNNNSYYENENHQMAKHWTLISPSNEIFKIVGTLKKFCNEHNLSWQTLYNNKNKGPIILDRTKYKNLSRLTPNFFNTIGWELQT